MRPGEALVGVAQIEVCIEVHDAHRRGTQGLADMAGTRHNRAVGDRMVAADDDGDLAARQEFAHGRIDMGVDAGTGGVDVVDIGLRRHAPADVGVDHPRGGDTGLVGRRGDPRRRGLHRDAGAIDAAEVSVEKVHLSARGVDGGWTEFGAGAKAHRRLKRHGHDDDGGLVDAEWEAVQAGGFKSRAVGVKRHERLVPAIKTTGKTPAACPSGGRVRRRRRRHPVAFDAL